MIIDPGTMLIQDFQQTNRQQVWEGIQRLMRNNFVDDEFILSLFRDWKYDCGVTTDDLLTMSALFPMRVMESLILSGFVPAQT